MSYILDYKANLGTAVVPEGGPEPIIPGPVSNNVNIQGNFTVTPVGYANPLLSVDDTGVISIGDSSSNNTIVMNTSIKYKYNSLTAANTNYTLTINDYGVEVNNNSYNTITLPSALNIGGKKYLVARGTSTNPSLVLQAQSGQTIDGNQTIALTLNKSHLEVISNGVDTWYII